ncbi:hypothetical protein COU54_05670 [Candidatus Pacearchaeota archaeon CG10_big_fil_rev_8_21_14_0_10_31_24]|nr:MAG: hypothetical protein COU54_05670 [Candidatus Pacearchaeota archaeon CG10_big_fil_rev_8_21_14_0_10_31_24]
MDDSLENRLKELYLQIKHFVNDEDDVYKEPEFNFTSEELQTPFNPVSNDFEFRTTIFEVTCTCHKGARLAIYLLNNYPDIDVKKYNEWRSPLHSAVSINTKVGNILLTKLLERNGDATVDVPNDYGHTPLHTAVQENNISAIRMLLIYGADPQLRFNLVREWYLDSAYMASVVKPKIREILDNHCNSLTKYALK